MRFAQIKQDYYPLKGGLDLQTPAIELFPGKVFDAQNYEPQISGGYRRINGYERADGRTSPSSAVYWVMTITQTGVISNGATITGATSSATGVVLGVYSTTLVLGRVSGTFVASENLQIAAVTVATSVTDATQRGASSKSDDADYMLLAADDRRTDILAVPGSGSIRGVHVYSDTLYAFRDSVDGLSGNLWKATTGGWTQITFGKEIQFTTATAEISAGNTITGATSGATALGVKAMLRTGTWTVGGAGTLIISTVTGTWQSGEGIKVGGVSKATSSSLATDIARAPGGRVECVNANFTGSTATEKMYGADGVNLAFEFDGTTYVPIRTGMTTDTPLHATEHKNFLFLSFLGSVQYSAIGNPYAWTVVLGAGELTTGSTCTGFLAQTGNNAGPSLAIYTRKKTFILYGSSSADFTLIPSNNDLGYSPYTMQNVGNNAYGLTARGIQSLITTLTYGDFDYESVSYAVTPVLAAKYGKEIASTTLKTKDQYRLFFSDGTALVIGLTGAKPVGIMPLNYGIVVSCITTNKLTTGEEVTYFGSTDGFVYRDNIGTSFDGEVIEAFIRPAFNNLKSPRLRKRYRRAVFEVKAEGYGQVNIAYDMGYGTTAVEASRITSQNMSGAGSYWDQFTWDQFNWDSPIFSSPGLAIEGTEKNIAFFFYSSRAQDAPHTVSGVTLLWSPRRMER